MPRKTNSSLPHIVRLSETKKTKVPSMLLSEETICDLEWLKGKTGGSYKKVFSRLFLDGRDTLLRTVLGGVELSGKKGGSVRKSYSLTPETVQAMDYAANEYGVSRSVLVDNAIPEYVAAIRGLVKQEAEARKRRLPQVLALKKALDGMDASFWREHSEVFGIMAEYIYDFLDEQEDL